MLWHNFIIIDHVTDKIGAQYISSSVTDDFTSHYFKFLYKLNYWHSFYGKESVELY